MDAMLPRIGGKCNTTPLPSIIFVLSLLSTWHVASALHGNTIPVIFFSTPILFKYPERTGPHIISPLVFDLFVKIAVRTKSEHQTVFVF
jgi:hypothetical protein